MVMRCGVVHGFPCWVHGFGAKRATLLLRRRTTYDSQQQGRCVRREENTKIRKYERKYENAENTGTEIVQYSKNLNYLYDVETPHFPLFC